MVDQSLGCLLVGAQLTPNLCGIVGGTSARAYAELKKAFYGTDTPNSTPNLDIRVAIRGGA